MSDRPTLKIVDAMPITSDTPMSSSSPPAPSPFLNPAGNNLLLEDDDMDPDMAAFLPMLREHLRGRAFFALSDEDGH